jgi:hypothetical protein
MPAVMRDNAGPCGAISMRGQCVNGELQSGWGAGSRRREVACAAFEQQWGRVAMGSPARGDGRVA